MFTNLRELKIFLDQQLKLASNERFVISNLLKEIAREDRFLQLLRSLVNDESMLEEIGARSCEHTNGFEKITLIDAGRSEYMLRLHIWWPENISPKPIDIHNHAWDFSSIVLVGSLRVQEFLVSDLGVYKYNYSCQATGFNPVLKFISRTKLECVFDCTLEHGSHYSLSNKILHRVIKNPSVTSVTLIMQGPFLLDSSSVYSDHPLDIRADGELPMRWLSASDVREKLSRLLNLLDSGSTGR